MMEEMTSMAISMAWFNDIKDNIPVENVYTYFDPAFQHEAVEFDTIETVFIRESVKKGWMYER